MTRRDVKFRSQGQECAGCFYPAAAEATNPRPCVVMAHGLGGIKEMRLGAYAEQFAAAGYHTLVFDYRHFGASDGQPRQLLDISKELQDWQAAIAHARTLPEVDANKIAIWGSSLSGGHVLATAAREPELAAVISQVPHFSGVAGVLALGFMPCVRLTFHGIYDALRGLLGMPPHYVLSSNEPGKLGLMTGPGDDEGYLKLVPPGQPFDQRVAARFALFIGLYSPGRHLAKLTMPNLVQVAMEDRVTPPGPAIRAAANSPLTTLKRYPKGHFEPPRESRRPVGLSQTVAA
ncbi:alpha/beta hydrolase [Pelomonas sp. Root1444]|uniref:alpha/beta hydrolase n=1 Tax=Pelomonas sp. Root1444 TaxID=1736464 RepID=UPI0009EC1431|nr:alpha/beta fold hydrolase [Pelomonas sp. Root1444]